MSDAISLAGVYLTLTGLIISIFFINLTQWFASTGALASKWDAWAKDDTRKTGQAFYEKRLDMYADAVALASPATFLAWIGISLFMAMIIVLIAILDKPNDPAAKSKLFWFLQLPCYSFFGLFFVASLIALILGYCNAKGVRDQASNTL